MKAMLLVLAVAATFSGAAGAQTPDRDREALEQARRDQLMLQQRDAEARVQRARERCIANRGTDCDTLDGLNEWLLLDRSRADAVLDRVAPLQLPAGSASAGSSVRR